MTLLTPFYAFLGLLLFLPLLGALWLLSWLAQTLRRLVG
jgi:hypothetical protein